MTSGRARPSVRIDRCPTYLAFSGSLRRGRRPPSGSRTVGVAEEAGAVARNTADPGLQGSGHGFS